MTGRNGSGRARAWTIVRGNSTARPAEIEVTVDPDSSPACSTAGITRETFDRVRAAIINSGYTWPSGRITVTTWPAGSPTDGQTQLDLPVACAIVAASRQIQHRRLNGTVLLGQLTLGGQLRPTPELLPSLRAARGAGARTAVVPAPVPDEATAVDGLTVLGASRLSEVLTWIPKRRIKHHPVLTNRVHKPMRPFL